MTYDSHQILPALGTVSVRARGRAILFALVVLLLGSSTGDAQQGITGVPVLGKIENIFLDDPADPWSSGTIVIDGTPIIVPRNLLIDLPANRLTLQQLYTDAPPACLAAGETGLALTDTCTEGRDAAYGQILANRLPSGHLIAGDVFIMKSATGEAAGALVPTTFGGFVSYIDHTDGYMVVNGMMGMRPAEHGGPPENQGYIVRINDPDGVHTIQRGLGCIPGMPNCSPDPRFTNDPENYTVTGSKGYPLCIPSTVTGGERNTGSDSLGQGDEFCPASNRILGGVSGREVPDSRRFVPFQVGDDVGGEGNWETINGVRFFSCHTISTAYGFVTRRTPDQPDYMTMAEVEWDAPGFQNERNKSLFIGFSTLEDSPMDIYALHVDPVTGENNEYIIASTIGNLGTINQGVPPTAEGIFKVGYDIDFIKGAPVVADVSPCQVLLNAGFPVCPLGGTLDEEFSIMSPISREVICRSRHRAELLPGNEPLNIRGLPASYGQYITPIGVGHPEFVEIDLDGNNNPFIFAGETWNLDRRLGPGGCEDNDLNGFCDSQVPLGELGLDPFPISGLDPRMQARIPVWSQERVFAHHPFGPDDFAPYPPLNPPDPALLAFAFAAPPGNRCGVPNSLPIAQADGAGIVTDEDTSLTILEADICANDTDPDGDSLLLFDVEGTTTRGGVVAWQPGLSELTYSPPPNEFGTDTFRYSVTDRHGGTAHATVVVTIDAVNDTPTPSDDEIAVPTGSGPITIAVAAILENDTDIDGDTLSIDSASGTGSLGGSLSLTLDSLVYENTSGAATGVDAFTYTVTDGAATATAQIRFHLGNEHPTAADDAVTTLEDTPIEILVVENDTDANPEDVALIVGSFSQGANGAVSAGGSPSSLIYTPGPEFSGSDSFTYTASDGRGGSGSATVFVTVIEVNDPPEAFPDFVTTPEDTPITVDVLANDTDAEGSPLTVFLDPALNALAFGAGSVEVVNNQIHYVPLLNRATVVPDVLIYSVTDGENVSTSSLSVVVSAVNDAPIALPDFAVTLEDTAIIVNPVLNDSDVENDTLRLVGLDLPADFPGTVTFTNSTLTVVPAPDFNDEVGVNFNYIVSDGRDQSIGQVTLIVLAENDVPVANDDLGNLVLEDSSIVIPVLDNDIDVDGDPLVVFSTTTPVRGTATIVPGGILYTPNPNAFGSDLFQYSLTDNVGGVSSATVAITIQGVSDAPDAGDDGPIPLAEDTVRVIQRSLLLQNDIDEDGDELSIVFLTQPQNGLLETIADPASGEIAALRYRPDVDFVGTDFFTYTLSDPTGLTSTANVTLTVLPVNDAPQAENDLFAIQQGGTGILSVLVNDSDADGDALTITEIVGGPLGGTATIEANGTITYIPAPSFFGNDTLIYRVTDGNGGTDTATVVIAVQQIAPTSMSFVRGDTNSDGQLNVSDPIGTLGVLFQGSQAICLASHDSNDDEAVNVGDIIFSLNYIFSTGEQPSAPFIFCGDDPTGGLLSCDGAVTCN